MICNVDLKLEGKIAELLAKIDPKAYENFIHMENGKKVMYVKLCKALYGTLQAALLFWQTLSEKLLKWGFEVNPYDWCVANKTINGKQCTVLWHVDDIKISHVDKNVVTQVLDLLSGEFGKEAPLTITRGKNISILACRLITPRKSRCRSPCMITYTTC